ncbi:MAG: ribulose-phosphate 3-epimerase [Aggregatilineales bacterium]
MPDIVPSLFAADHSRLQDAVRAAWEGGARHFHVDIMDGVFVPSIGLSIQLIADLNKAVPAGAYHAHMMTVEPQKLVEAVIAAGAISVTVHIEAVPQPEDLLRKIQASGALAGLALNPGTSPQSLASLGLAPNIVQVMTVNAGHPGQTFIADVLPKIRRVREIVPDAIIAVDGQVSAATLPQVVASGAEFIVCGRGVFDGDPCQTLADLYRLLQ